MSELAIFSAEMPGLDRIRFHGQPRPGEVHLTPNRKFPFFNADIDCRLLKYEMYAGSRRKDRNRGPAEIPGSYVT
jgi:putative N6-adenine-specific DNA methylase